MSKKAKLNEKFKGDYLAMDTVEKLADEQKPNLSFPLKKILAQYSFYVIM